MNRFYLLGNNPLVRHLFIVFFLAASAIAGSQDLAHTFPYYCTLHAMHADIIPRSAGEKAALAEAIIEGEVVATQSFWKNNRVVSTLTIATGGKPAGCYSLRSMSITELRT